MPKKSNKQSQQTHTQIDLNRMLELCTPDNPTPESREACETFGRMFQRAVYGPNWNPECVQALFPALLAINEEMDRVEKMEAMYAGHVAA